MLRSPRRRLRASRGRNDPDGREEPERVHVPDAAYSLAPSSPSPAINSPCEEGRCSRDYEQDATRRRIASFLNIRLRLNCNKRAPLLSRSGFVSLSGGDSLMTRLLSIILLCVLASSRAPAQNDASQGLLALSEDDRNAVLTYLLQSSSEKCDRVIRTLFNGTALGLDNWEVLCRDRNSYSLSIPPGVNTNIELVSCRELIATSKRLLERADRKSKATGCRIK